MGHLVIISVTSSRVTCQERVQTGKLRLCCSRGLKESFLEEVDLGKKQVELKGSFLGSNTGTCMVQATGLGKEGRRLTRGKKPGEIKCMAESFQK